MTSYTLKELAQLQKRGYAFLAGEKETPVTYRKFLESQLSKLGERFCENKNIKSRVDAQIKIVNSVKRLTENDWGEINCMILSYTQQEINREAAYDDYVSENWVNVDQFINSDNFYKSISYEIMLLG